MLKHLKNAMNRATTENGGLAHATTQSKVLDFFAQGGALRQRSETEIVDMFNKAYREDPQLALRALFYFRDIRGGQGERRTFRVILKNAGDIVAKLIPLIPEYGRWDDLYVLFGTIHQEAALALIKDQFRKDVGADKPSILGKWLPAENASSAETRAHAKIIRKALGLNPKTYRKALVSLRMRIKLVETQMSKNEWKTIDYETVPSRANLIYRKAFSRHDPERYTAFIGDVKTGKKKMNASALYPHDVVNKVLNQGDTSDAIDAMWKSLPDYTKGVENSIAVVDVSGSMMGVPITMSIGLGLYIAEHAKGPYQNHFITFSRTPHLQEIKGKTIADKMHGMITNDWMQNTDFHAVFRMILHVAKTNKVAKEDMIQKIYVISDMEFDEAACGMFNETVLQTIRREYAESGYELPKIVFWNVNARTEQYPAAMSEQGVQLVSGSSPAILKFLMTGEFVGPYELMLRVLNSPRYEKIVV